MQQTTIHNTRRKHTYIHAYVYLCFMCVCTHTQYNNVADTVANEAAVLTNALADTFSVLNIPVRIVDTPKWKWLVQIIRNTRCSIPVRQTVTKYIYQLSDERREKVRADIHKPPHTPVNYNRHICLCINVWCEEAVN